MARYIDADRFKSNLEKAMEKMHVINGIHAVGLEAVIESLDRQTTADVVPRSEVAREILREVRQALLNMVLSNSMGETYDIEKRFAEIEKKYTEGKDTNVPTSPKDEFAKMLSENWKWGEEP